MSARAFAGGRNRVRTLAFQCPQCLTRDIKHHVCNCEHDEGRPPRHSGSLLRDGDTCDAMCNVCGWGGEWPTIPDDTPEGLATTAQQWLDLGHTPTEALYLAWLWMDPSDPIMARFAGPNACNKAGETLIDLVTILVRADRLPCGDDPVEAVKGICERLDKLERREDERYNNHASPSKTNG